MPVIPNETAEGAQNVEWSEALHAWLFRARIYFKRYWWVFLFTLSGGVGMQAWREYNRPPQFVSHAEMRVPPNLLPVSTLTGGISPLQQIAYYFDDDILQLQDSDLKEKAYDNLKAQHPEMHIPAGLPAIGVNQIPNVPRLSLTATGTDAVYTQFFLNALMAAFLDKQEEDTNNEAKQANNKLGSLAYTFDKRVQDDEAKVREFNKDHNITSIATVLQDANDKYRNNKKDLSDLQDFERTYLAANTAQAANGTAMTPPPGQETIQSFATRDAQLEEQFRKADVTAEYIEGNNTASVDLTLLSPGSGLATPVDGYLANKHDLEKLQAELRELSYNLMPEHPKITGINASIAELEARLKEQRRQNAARLAEYKEVVLTRIKLTRDNLAAADQDIQQFNTLKTEYDQLAAQLDSDRTIEQEANSNQSKVDVGNILTPEQLVTNKQASPASEVGVDPVRQIGVGAFVGLVAGAALIFGLGILDGRAMSVEDISQRFDEPTLGIIPMQKRVAGFVELLRPNDQRLMFAESCRNIRSSLLYMDRQGRRPQSIVLTSSIPSEGKSTISSNLAITLGFASSKTLLVDADLRRGGLHKRFGIKNTIGLAEHIANGVPIDQVIQPTGFENLDFIPCGQYPDKPGELLMSERFTQTMAELKTRYDFIVFDSPPVLATDDAASFATRADAVIFVIRASYTRIRQIRASLENLYRRGVQVYGFVFNFIDHREPGYYSYKYYDYYSYRAPEKKP